MTANQAAATEDLVSRAVFVSLRYEGDPGARSFARDPLEYAAEHRHEILGELVAMVQRWVESGRPMGAHNHRCSRWAALVGGILTANGLGEWFLAGQAEAAEQVDEGLQTITALAEHVVIAGRKEFFVETGADASRVGRTAHDWVPLFEQSLMLHDAIKAKTTRGKDSGVGNFLAAKVGRSVTISHDQFVSATLRKRPGGARKNFYYFEVAPAVAGEPRERAGPDGASPTAAGESQAECSAVNIPTLPTRPFAGVGGGNNLEWGEPVNVSDPRPRGGFTDTKTNPDNALS